MASSVGKYTYGTKPNVHFANNKAKLTFGSFCSIAKNLNVYLGGNHRTDWVTTYPSAMFIKINLII